MSAAAVYTTFSAESCAEDCWRKYLASLYERWRCGQMYLTPLVAQQALIAVQCI